MGESSADGPGAARIDRWLFAVRLFKSRSVAADAVSGGKVHVNGERVKPSRSLRPGDAISLLRGALEFECTVNSIPLRRGPASEAAGCYAETAASEERRRAYAERRRLVAGPTPRPSERPQKHERMALRRLRGRE